MGLKDNVNFVKNELNNEEKFLEGFVKLERFYKKYKVLIISVVIAIIVGSIGLSVKSYLDNKNKIKANIAFNKVLKDFNNKEALKALEKSNKKLYEIALYLKAQKDKKPAKINVEFFKSLYDYQQAMKEKSLSQLSAVSMKRDFLLKEFAIFNKALLEATNGQYKKSKATLKLIGKKSNVYELAQTLNHYLLTK